MLKAIYYYKGFKILADNEKNAGMFYVFRLQKGKYTYIPGRRGSGAVSGVFIESFRSYKEAVQCIKDSFLKKEKN